MVSSFNIPASRILLDSGDWTCWDPIWAVWDLSRSKKGHFGPKKGLLGPLAATKKNHTRSKCVVTMSPTQLDYPMAVGPKSGPPGLPKGLRGPQNGFLGQIGPFGAPVVTKKALGWANKTYYYVFYM